MWSRLLALALLLLPAPALAGAKEKVAALAPSGLVLVMDEKGNELIAQHADQPFVPASVTKIVTAWLAMEVLGRDYRFETCFYLDDKRVLYASDIHRKQRYFVTNGQSPNVVKLIAYHASEWECGVLPNAADADALVHSFARAFRNYRSSL